MNKQIIYLSVLSTLTFHVKKLESRLKSQRRREEKERRMTGKSYYGFRTTKETKSWVQDVPKSERQMGDRCSSELCAKNIQKRCSIIPDETRLEIFNNFWNNLDWRAKRSYVRSLVDKVPPKRRRNKHKGAISRKGDTRLYHLTLHNQRIPVCRVMFLNTLGVKEAMVRCWMAGDRPRIPKKPLKTLDVTSYIAGIPNLPPKCLKCTGIRYVNLDGIKNLHQLYNLYVKDTLTGGSIPASRKTFSKVAASMNLRFFRPKNDMDICDLDIDLHILPRENRIKAEELQDQIDSTAEPPKLIDVRSEPEFEMCRIDGSINYPIESFYGSKVAEVLDMIEKGDRVTFICRRGNDSQVAANTVLGLLKDEHKSKVKDLVGGLHSWSQNVDLDFPVY